LAAIVSHHHLRLGNIEKVMVVLETSKEFSYFCICACLAEALNEEMVSKSMDEPAASHHPDSPMR
jgi:hypothetical protein